MRNYLIRLLRARRIDSIRRARIATSYSQAFELVYVDGGLTSDDAVRASKLFAKTITRLNQYKVAKIKLKRAAAKLGAAQQVG